MRSVLSKHVGFIVAINATKPTTWDVCGLKAADEEFFSVVTQGDLLMHVPYSRILSATESHEGEGVRITTASGAKAFKLVIEIEHMIIYKGGTAVGFSMPTDFQ